MSGQHHRSFVGSNQGLGNSVCAHGPAGALKAAAGQGRGRRLSRVYGNRQHDRQRQEK